MTKRKAGPVAVVPADPAQWSAQSRGSVSASWTAQYEDIAYLCTSCRKAAVFSAADQKISYEVKKNHIWQSRNLCEACRTYSRANAAAMVACEERWAHEKDCLKGDKVFLAAWLDLLLQQDRYTRKRNTAAQGMLRKLLAAVANVEEG